MTADSVSDKNLLSGIASCLLTVCSNGRRDESTLWGLFTRPLIPFVKSPPSWPNHLPKTPPPNTIPLGCTLWHKNLGGGIHIHTVHSIPDFVVVQSLNCVRLFVTPCQASLSFTISWSSLKFMSIESMVPSNHLILCHPLLLPSIFPSNRVFSNELALSIRWPNYWSFSFTSVLPMNIQDWFPLGLTGLITLLSKGLSRVFSNTTVQNHQLFSAQLSLWSNSHPYWKSLALTIQTFVGKVVSLFFNMLSRFVILIEIIVNL